MTTKTPTGQRKRHAAISRKKANEEIDIGDVPKCVDPGRREACRLNFKMACETYWPDRFPLAWSQDHLDAIKLIERVTLEGGQYAFSMFRGGGKTTLCETAAEWALLNGHRRFLGVVGATNEAALDILNTIKTDLETNEKLLEDFPEVVYPILKLEGEPRRCKRQTHHGERTRIEWGLHEIVFATIPGSITSGSILRVRGMTGRLRGMKRGKLRPDLALLDDPQTDESSASPTGNAKYKKLIQRVILKWAGPKTLISCLMPCTCINVDDLVDEFTNRELHPEWNGDRRKFMLELPKNREWWDKYKEVRADGLRTGDGGKAGTELYLAEQAIADEGAVVAWPQFTKGKASAVQYFMDEFIDDRNGALAELNNDPRREDLIGDLRQVEEPDLVLKLNRSNRGIVPPNYNHLTAFLDVQDEVIFWMVAGWDEKFGGAVVDYGTYPEQYQEVFKVDDCNPKLSSRFPDFERAARISAGVAQTIQLLFAKNFGGLALSMVFIDSGFEAKAVYDIVNRSSFRSLLRATKGRGIGAAGKPMNEFRKAQGDRVGDNWRQEFEHRIKGQLVMYCTNSWKSRIAEGLLAPPGAAAAIYLPGNALLEHRLLTIHLLSEYRVPTFGHGRRVEEWKIRPEHNENHWWDCIVGCAVAASYAGVRFDAAAVAGMPGEPNAAPKRIKLSELQAAKRAAGAYRV